MQKTQKMRVQFLGWEEPLEKGMATHFSMLAWRTPRTEEPGSPWDCPESDTTVQLSFTEFYAANQEQGDPMY